MELTNNFVAAVRPLRLWQLSNRSRVVFEKGHYTAIYDTSGLSIKSPDEAEFWGMVASRTPFILDDLAKSHFLTYRASYARSQIIINSGRGALAQMEADVEDKVVLMHDTVLACLGADRKTLAQTTARHAQSSKNAGFLKVSSKVMLPGLADKQLVTVFAFPDALDAAAWTLRVSLPSPTNELMAQYQAGVLRAHEKLAEKGIIIRDTLTGSPMVLI